MLIIIANALYRYVFPSYTRRNSRERDVRHSVIRFLSNHQIDLDFSELMPKPKPVRAKKKDTQRTIHARIETWKPLWIVNIPNLQLKTSKKNANAPRKLNIYFIYTYSGAFINVFFLFLFLSFFVQTKTKIKCETWQFYSKVSMYFSIQLSRQMC